MTLEGLQSVEQQISQLDQEIASLLHQYQDAVESLVVVPDLGVHASQQIVAEMAGTQRVMQLCRRGTQALIGQGG